jgi:4-hydroxy-tetrahydrodipicolinate reductase
MKICIGGCKGKMGSRVAELARDEADMEVAGSFDIGDDAEAQVGGADCLIEFTAPGATMEHLALCEKLGKAIVIGTTGLSEADRERVAAASRKIPVLMSPNMSIGVNVLFRLAADAAKALGSQYHVEIVEAHHSEKKDAPSGTAKEIARIVRAERPDAEVPIESVREGDIVGEHTVTFESDVDAIELTHSAKTRDIFAKGALRAARFLHGKGAGLYTMKDALKL